MEKKAGKEARRARREEEKRDAAPEWVQEEVASGSKDEVRETRWVPAPGAEAFPKRARIGREEEPGVEEMFAPSEVDEDDKEKEQPGTGNSGDATGNTKREPEEGEECRPR